MMVLNRYAMEMHEAVYRGMGRQIEFFQRLGWIPQTIDPAAVFETTLWEEVDLSLVTWKSLVATR